MSEHFPKTVLTIAGFDPSSGAGITADLKTISAHGLYGTACITSLTVQSTRGVRRMEAVPPDLVLETIAALVEDIPPAAVKIGMLGSGRIAKVVAGFLKKTCLPNIVLDPVLRSSSGKALLDRSGIRVLQELLGLVDVVTPNIEEAGVLAGRTVGNEEDMEEACRTLQRMGAKNAVITGGHLRHPVDVLLGEQTQGIVQRYRHEKVETRSTHGTGCAYSTAIACNLAKGISLAGEEGNAIFLAGQYVHAALKEAYPIGKGTGPINHLHHRR